MSSRKDVIIIGAGASGLMCAIEAGKRGRSVLLLDHAERTASKIRVSGGGRCNFTNLHAGPGYYLSENPDFCRSALSRFSPEDFTCLLDRHGIRYYEKEKGQLFCRQTSRAVVGMLHTECRNVAAEIRLQQKVEWVEKKERFVIKAGRNIFEAGSLVIATGGLSYASLGASDLGYRVAGQFGMKITPVRPGLVPLTFPGQEAAFFRELSGVSLDASIRCGKQGLRGEILFTHGGMSGPAILQTSLYWKSGMPISIDLLPDLDAVKLFAEESKSRIEMHNLLARYLPKRFIKMFCESYFGSRPLCQYNRKELENIAGRLHHWSLKPTGTAGYSQAEVTAGGIDTREVSSKTFEARKVPGLYFIGEVLDVTGQLGGFNLHWAWASGSAAGHYV